MHTVMWMAYDLGVKGDYEGLYAWLDDHSAAECGNSVAVSDHRGSNSQLIDFEGVEICPIFTAKIENSEKSST